MDRNEWRGKGDSTAAAEEEEVEAEVGEGSERITGSAKERVEEGTNNKIKAKGEKIRQTFSPPLISIISGRPSIQGPSSALFFPLTVSWAIDFQHRPHIIQMLSENWARGVSFLKVEHKPKWFNGVDAKGFLDLTSISNPQAFSIG